MVDSIDYRKWILRAKQDIRTIENNLRDDQDFLAEINCYLAQQAVEKMLKAFLLFKESVLPKTHDLLYLMKKCTEFDNRFSEISNELEILNLYSIEARYPGDLLGDLSKEQAQSAYRATIKTKNFVESLIKE